MNTLLTANLGATTRDTMNDALRLTRAGRLNDAVEAIAKGLGGLTATRARPPARAISCWPTSRRSSTTRRCRSW